MSEPTPLRPWTRCPHIRQISFRTGPLKVGLPAAKQGLQHNDPTIAELLKPLPYATAQIPRRL
jgi:hypothetical protein